MARNPTGKDALNQARIDLLTAETAAELRVAQAVVFPLDLGISLTQTAELIGKTSGWVARARIHYIRQYENAELPNVRGGRRNNLLAPDEEIEFVKAALLEPRVKFLSDVKALKLALEKRVGRRVALSTAYNILNRVQEHLDTSPKVDFSSRRYLSY